MVVRLLHFLVSNNENRYFMDPHAAYPDPDSAVDERVGCLSRLRHCMTGPHGVQMSAPTLGVSCDTLPG